MKRLATCLRPHLKSPAATCLFGAWLAAVAATGCGQTASTTTTAADSGGAATDTRAGAADTQPVSADTQASLADSQAGSADTQAGTADGQPGADTQAATGCPPAVHLLDVAKGKGAGGGVSGATLSGSCTADSFTVQSNGVPFYTYVAMTPNALKTVQQSWTIPRSPKLAAQTSELPLLGPAGFTVAGLPFYGPNEGTQPAAEIYGDPVYNGLMDGCMGHTSPQEYHNHALRVKCLTKAALAVGEPWTLADEDGKQPSPLIGWALDGFAVYGPYGCLDKACTQVAEMKSGYVKTGDPKTYAWKAYTYTAQPGDPTVLDACNGRVQPDGSYAYHATSGFPYILGCYKGTPTGNGSSGGGGASGPGGGSGGAGGNGGGMGPATCTTSADCGGKCPAGSAGCGCDTTPMGKMCVPTCTSNSDCKPAPGGMATTCQQGFCRP